MKFGRVSLLSLLSLAVATIPKKGPYKTSRHFFSVPALDATVGKGTMNVYFPVTDGSNETFPLVSYAHGYAGGGIDILGYSRLFNDMASYGFIIVAPDTCMVACGFGTDHPYTDCNPAAQNTHGPYAAWYGEQLKAIDWSMNSSSDPSHFLYNRVDWTAGVGIAGHSMGGQATAWSAHDNCTARWNIKAAALHHAFNSDLPDGLAGTNITKTPVAGFTSPDFCCEDSTKRVVDASTASPKLYRDIKGSSHLEPVLEPPVYNTNLATYTAAWFKVHLKGDAGIYYDLIFNESGPDHLCKSQKMKECYVNRDSELSV